MGKATGSIEIEASPEKVFAFILDSEKFNEINRGHLEMEPTSKGPVGVGSTSHWVGTAGGNQQEFDMEITEFVKNKKMITRTIGASKFKGTASFDRSMLPPFFHGRSLLIKVLERSSIPNYKRALSISGFSVCLLGSGVCITYCMVFLGVLW